MLISFLLLYIIIYEVYTQKGKIVNWRMPLICTSVVWFFFLFAVTEFLSVFSLLKRTVLFSVWGGFSIILFIALLLEKRHMKIWIFLTGLQIRKKVRAIHIVTVIFMLFMLLVAVETVPYNYDSMTYHLSRICHWTQNSSVSHFATNIVRQVTSPVLHEFVNLHIYILLGKKDAFLNLVQCVSYFVNAVMVYGIAQKLQCHKKLCFIAMLLYLSMPIAFAEALSTQNDNFATTWLLYFVYIIVDFAEVGQKMKFDKGTIVKVSMLGALISLGYLSKPSVCIGMAVILFWLLTICVIRKDSCVVLMKLVGIAVPVIVLPLVPEILRNVKTFGAISDPIAGQRQLIGTLNPFYVIINFLKNFLYNLSNRYIDNSNNLITGIIEKAAIILRVDLNSPLISEDGRTFSMHIASDYSHDVAVNSTIMALMVFFCIHALMHIRRIKFKELLSGYSFISVICFLLFCAVLRWEPYVTRYMVSYLALLCPMIALQLEKGFKEQSRTFLMGIICFACFIEMFNMGEYHLKFIRWGGNERTVGYFVRNVSSYESYYNLCSGIKDQEITTVGLKTGEDDFEYPIWKMLEEKVERIEHVYVENATSRYEMHDYLPECIIWIGELPEEPIIRDGKIYNVKMNYENRYYLLMEQDLWQEREKIIG